jgi:decaprenylphospho-beta-D-ribofuranose 2-oxidase
MLAARPERVSELPAILAATGREGVIVHAGGRSYGDSALNTGGRAILTRRLDRLLEFDPASGLLAAEAGVSFDDLRRLLLPRGFLAPVTPGTAFATLGGAVANDVHGKNQDQAGNFGSHVEWLDLMLPSGEVRRLTAADPLFRATVGGLGLTGVILAVAFRMMAVPSRFVALRERRVADLDGFLAALETERRRAVYSVGWIEALARGRALGRGIVEAADPPLPSRRIPMPRPSTVASPSSCPAWPEPAQHRGLQCPLLAARAGGGARAPRGL